MTHQLAIAFVLLLLSVLADAFAAMFEVACIIAHAVAPSPVTELVETGLQLMGEIWR